MNEWPTKVIAYLFPAGSLMMLDGGRLDLGIVRDSALNAASDYEIFFETVFFRGGESCRISQPLTPSGVARAAA